MTQMIANKTEQLKEALSGAYRAKDLAAVNEILESLEPGSRVLVIAKSKLLPIMGWKDDRAGGELEERAFVVEGRNSFCGAAFVFDRDGHLALLAGTEPRHPWARLAFAHDGTPNFKLAIVGPADSSSQAQYV